MKIVFPVEIFCGSDSVLFEHFGSSPFFALADTETGAIEQLTNPDQEHEHGACNPLRALGAASPDAIVVGGIGAGALNGLRNAGIRVFKSNARTIGEVLGNLEGSLLEILPTDVCGSAHSGGGCGCSCH
ncbi:TPA: diguanylate cyclase [Candidatus Sumerlaeota bacterium]|jgi:predicted Fe-Mo cluster-binding NifX family protein|nr:diguanylate cyclase [Candidatus Sumerlaeota bacterium]